MPVTVTTKIAKEYFKKSTVETFPVYLTLQELQDIEEILWEKSNILQAIADQLIYKKETINAERLDKKAVYIETLATKIGLPLDTKYIKEINNANL